jgi:hypothetical protein
MSIATSLRNRSEKYHVLIHILCGFLCAYIAIDYFPDISHTKLNIIGVLGSLSPDVDHVMYWFIYGKKSQYSQIVRSLLRRRQFKNFYKFIRGNHKTLTGLYFHNFLTLALSVFLSSFYGFSRQHPYLMVFFMAWSVHYIFDLCEDLLFFKRLNPNWYFRFNKVTRDIKYIEHRVGD